MNATYFYTVTKVLWSERTGKSKNTGERESEKDRKSVTNKVG